MSTSLINLFSSAISSRLLLPVLVVIVCFAISCNDKTSILRSRFQKELSTMTLDDVVLMINSRSDNTVRNIFSLMQYNYTEAHAYALNIKYKEVYRLLIGVENDGVDIRYFNPDNEKHAHFTNYDNYNEAIQDFMPESKEPIVYWIVLTVSCFDAGDQLISEITDQINDYMEPIKKRTMIHENPTIHLAKGLIDKETIITVSMLAVVVE